MDAEGNVMGVRRGSGPAAGRCCVVNAHLDTVFPEGTDVKVKRAGHGLMAPGIGDDTRGLALMLALIRDDGRREVQTPGDILFVGNVGEEGEGDLRGIKFLLQKGKYKDRIKQVRRHRRRRARTHVTRGGVGSRRYRVTFKGPGGHSYGAFGLVNPAFAMGGAIAKFSQPRGAGDAEDDFSVGVVAAARRSTRFPPRSRWTSTCGPKSCAELKKIDDAFLAHRARGGGRGEHGRDRRRKARSRPTRRSSASGRAARRRSTRRSSRPRPRRSARSAGRPTFTISSTDANIPMSLGIPAITIGRGGPGGRSHSPDEWTDVDPATNVRNVQVALAIVLSVAGGR